MAGGATVREAQLARHVAWGESYRIAAAPLLHDRRAGNAPGTADGRLIKQRPRHPCSTCNMILGYGLRGKRHEEIAPLESLAHRMADLWGGGFGGRAALPAGGRCVSRRAARPLQRRLRRAPAPGRGVSAGGSGFWRRPAP